MICKKIEASRKRALSRVQKLRGLFKGERSALDFLLAERRRESAHEAAKLEKLWKKTSR